MKPATSATSSILPILVLRRTFEHVSDNDFISLFQSCHDIRTISLATLLERYISSGICHFGHGLRFSSNSIQDLRAALASITELSCSVSLQNLFLRSADTNGDRLPRTYRALGSLLASLPHLSTITVTIARDTGDSRHSVRCPATQLIRGFLSNRSSNQAANLLILGPGMDPFVSTPRRILPPFPWPHICRTCIPTMPLRFVARIQRILFTLDEAIRRVPFYIADPLGHGNPIVRVQEDTARLDFQFTSFRITDLPSSHWTMVVPNITTFSSLMMDGNIGSLKWDTVLPILHLPVLQAVTVLPGCRVSKAALCAFLSRHPSVTSLFLRSFHITGLLPNAGREEQRTPWPVPNLTVLGAQLTVMERVLPDIDLQKVTTIIIGNDNFIGRSTTFLGLPLLPRRKFPFDTLGRVLDGLATCNATSLTLSLPGGMSSKDWLAVRGNETSAAERGWASLRTLEVYPLRDVLFTPDVKELLLKWAMLFPSLEKQVVHPTSENEANSD